MNTWAPLFSKIVDSSVWTLPYPVRVLWTTMLALKDADHVVRFNAFGLARRANMGEQEVLDGLELLASADKERIEPQPHEGRRIEKVPDGWLILNGHIYQNMMRKANRREYNRRKQAEYRGLGRNGETLEERLKVKAMEDDRTASDQTL